MKKSSIVFLLSFSSPVVYLFFPRCPSAVVWLVVPVNVDPVYGQIVSVSVGQSPVAENRIIMPFLTDSDSATAVILVSLEVGISAPVVHISPYPVQSLWLAAMCPVGFVHGY